MAAIDGNAKVVAVIGNPIAHSLSPMIHEYWIQKHRLNAAYIPLCLGPEIFTSGIRLLAQSGVVGFNITLPFKGEAYKLVDNHERSAMHCGSVNCIYAETTGFLIGTNTDIYGFQALFDHAMAGNPQMTRGPIAVLGSGGAARAVLCALKEYAECDIIVINRSPENAHTIVSELGINARVHPMDKALPQECSPTCIVNTLPYHINATKAYEAVIERVARDGVAIDISYAKERTPFLKIASTKLSRSFDGLLMLAWQAVPSFSAWFGITPEVTVELMHKLRGKLNG